LGPPPPNKTPSTNPKKKQQRHPFPIIRFFVEGRTLESVFHRKYFLDKARKPHAELGSPGEPASTPGPKTLGARGGVRDEKEKGCDQLFTRNLHYKPLGFR